MARKASPFERLDWGRCTRKRLATGGTRLYLHVFDWPSDGKLVVPVASGSGARAKLLAGGKTLAVQAGDRQTTIVVGDKAPDAIATVVQLDLDGPPKVLKP